MKSNQIKQAFESVQADSDLADRVLYAAAGEPLRRKGHAKPLYVAVIGCLAGVLATGGVAYAVVNSSYFASAWGNHGNGESVTWTNGGSSGTKYTYTREFGDGIAPQSWRVQSRRSICPSRATAIRSTFMRWQSTRTVAVL